MLLHHGVLAPHARWRPQVVSFGKSAASEEAAARRAFGIDVLACPRCGARPRRIATVEDPGVAGKILARLRVLHPADSPGPAPPSDDLRPAAPSHQSSVPVSEWDLALQNAS